MKKNYLLILFLSLTLFSKASIHNIYLSCIGISPSSMSAVCGDTIKWIWGGCSDTLTSTSIPACATAWSSQVNATTSTYQIVVPCAGTYNYKCQGFTGVINVSCTTTEIARITDQTSAIRIYPNPTTGIINMAMTDTGNLKQDELKIYNVLGDCVHQLSNDQLQKNSDLTIDLSSQPNGIYFIQLKSAKGTEIKKIVLSK